MAATKTISIATGGTNQATTTAAEINNFATDFIANGVVGAITLNTGSGGTGAFAPNAQASPNMTVRITGGAGYVTATPAGGTSQRIRFNADTFEDVTIANNTSGSTRYDWIYAQIDPTNLANPAVNKDNVFTYVVSRSTSNATDNGTPPTYGYNIAVVTVANNAVSITNSNITDSRAQTGPSSLAASVTLPTTTVVGSQSLSNPYKFSVWRSAAVNTGNGAFAVINFDTKEYDTGTNVASGVFTAPVAGFYRFSARASWTSTRGILSLFKNGTEVKRGTDTTVASSEIGTVVTAELQLAASDTIDIRAFGAAAVAINNTQATCYFMGSLISKT